MDRLLVESLLSDLAQRGIRTVEWLIHPGNTVSFAFSRAVFPDNEETYPPEDKPYARFVIGL